MPRLDYLHLDVFTNRQFEGNQLAVYSGRPRIGRRDDAADRPRDELLRDDVHPAARAERYGRAHAHFHARRRIADGGSPDDRQHVRAGASRNDRARPRVVRLRPRRRAHARRAVVGERRAVVRVDGSAAAGDTAAASCRANSSRARPARITRRISRTGLPIQEITCGVPYVLLPLATRADVDAAEPDVASIAGAEERVRQRSHRRCSSSPPNRPSPA